MSWLLIALLSGLPIALAKPSEEAMALADAPVDPAKRLALARSLLGRQGWEEAGLQSLNNLLSVPAAHDQAQAALAEFLGRVDGRPGWARLYSSLLSSGSFRGSEVVVLRQAEASALDSGTRSKGLAQLDAIAKSADPTLSRYLGRAFLRVGEGERAARAFAAAGAAGAEGRLLAALATGDSNAASALADTGAPRALGVDDALRIGSLDARAEALAANGFVQMAARMLESGTVEEHGRQLAALYQAKGRWVEASIVLNRLRRAGVSDAASDRRLAEVYAARRMYKEAVPLVPGDAAFTEQLRTLAAYKSAWESRSRSDDLPALEAAWASAPTDPFVAREWGKAKLRDARPGEAFPALGLALDIDPTDADALGLYGLAGEQLGSQSSIVRRLLLGAAAETSASERAALLAKTAIYLGILAEEYKRRGAMDDAIETYLIASLLDPAETGKIKGAAGLLWQAQHPVGALAMYELARRAKPNDVDLFLSCVRLESQLGHEEAALALLSTTKLKDSRIKLMRRTIENGIRAREARVAANEGDLAAAAVLWGQLVQEWPDESEFVHGLADALAGLGQYEQAITAYRRTLELNSQDSWAVLGQANCLIATYRPTEARELIHAAYTEGNDPSADGERKNVVARAWRAEAQTLQDSGRSLEAFDAWREAFTLVPDVWATNGLASLYLEHDQPEVAVAFYDEAIEVADNTASEVGRAIALERLGRWDEALASADAIVLRDPTDTAVLARRQIVQRVAVAQAEYARRTGKASAARDQLRKVIASEGPTAELWAASAAASLDILDCPSAISAAKEAMEADPKSTWALDVALRAGTVCHAMPDLYAHIQEAVAVGGHDPQRQLRAARIELTIQRSEKLLSAGRTAEATTPLTEAEAIGPATADEWARLGGAWVGAGRPAHGIECFNQALSQSPHHVPAIIGIGGALRSQVRLGAAEEHLQRYYDELLDPRIGLQLVQLQIQRGEYKQAEATLTDTKSRALLPEAEPVAAETHVQPLPVLPLPSGRQPEPRTWPPTPPADLQPRWLVDARDAIDIALLQEKSAYISVGGAVFQRPGLPGEQQLFGYYIPAEVVFPPVGLLRFNADAAVVGLDDGEDQHLGVATSVGVASPAFRRFFATARIGTSPIGFDNINLLWNANIQYGVAPGLSLGGVTARVPVSDSLLAWAGKADPVTQQFFGMVSQIWFGGYASFTPSRRIDAGAIVRGGWTEGYGIEINPFGEGVGWAGVSIGNPAFSARIGAEAVALTHSRQEDGFLLGQGGYFSPPVFVMGGPNAKLKVHISGSKAILCANVFAGAQYVDGQPTPWFGTGVTGVGRAGIGASARISPWVSVGIDGRVQLTSDLWHQEAGILHLDYGLQPGGPSAPTMTTVASPGAILPASADLCRVE